MSYILLIVSVVLCYQANADYLLKADRHVLSDFGSTKLEKTLALLPRKINKKRASAMCMELLKKEVIPNPKNINYDPNVNVLTVKGARGVTVYTGEGMVSVNSNTDLSCSPNSDTSSKFIRNWISSFSKKLTAKSITKARAINFYCSRSHDSTIRQASNSLARIINSKDKSADSSSNSPPME